MNYDIPKVKRKKWPRKVLGELANFLEQFYPDGLSLTGVAKDLAQRLRPYPTCSAGTT